MLDMLKKCRPKKAIRLKAITGSAGERVLQKTGAECDVTRKISFLVATTVHYSQALRNFYNERVFMHYRSASRSCFYTEVNHDEKGILVYV